MTTALSLMFITSGGTLLGSAIGLRGPVCALAIAGATVGCWALSA